jgi:hypothetical protein
VTGLLQILFVQRNVIGYPADMWFINVGHHPDAHGYIVSANRIPGEPHFGAAADDRFSSLC